MKPVRHFAKRRETGPTELEVQMNKRILTALALSLAFLPIADVALAQQLCPNQRCPSSSDAPSLPTASICFCSGEDLKGTFFCEAGLRSVASVPAQWRSRVKSIAVGEHSSVKVCSENTLQGTCVQYDETIKKLPKPLFNHVYSYDIGQDY